MEPQRRLFFLVMILAALIAAPAIAEEAVEDPAASEGDEQPAAESATPAPREGHELVGRIWQKGHATWGGGGLNEHYILFDDGMFLHSLSYCSRDAEPHPLTLARVGSWRVEDGQLTLQTALEWFDPQARCPWVEGPRSGTVLRLGEPVVRTTDETLTARLVTAPDNPDDADESEREWIKIGDERYTAEISALLSEFERLAWALGDAFFLPMHGERFTPQRYLNLINRGLPDEFIKHMGCAADDEGSFTCEGSP